MSQGSPFAPRVDQRGTMPWPFLSSALGEPQPINLVTQIFDQPLPDNCPPQSATARQQAAYRIVKDESPSAADFKTHAELGLAPSADQCRRSSLSIFATFRQAAHRQNLTPTLGAHIAHATLTPAHGLISPQNSVGHMEWWAHSGMVKPNEFSVVTGEH